MDPLTYMIAPMPIDRDSTVSRGTCLYRLAHPLTGNSANRTNLGELGSSVNLPERSRSSN